MKVYSFLNTIVLVNGIEITGWGEGDDVIQVNRLEDSISHVMGAGGEMSVSISADRSGQFVLTLQQGSESNAFLSAIIAASEALNFVPVSVQFKDTSGNDLSVGSKGYITRPADLTRGTAINSQEWTIVVENLQQVLGGSGAV